ncbi:MAG: 3-methyl-2-oxobutanoate hydroxymethyltransferase [Bacteriovoracaceae bacterium]|nr:3-methyl-2-oxobutanoate hydroxymethyltransferase [Bacteriovoracaceae bacterium]
MSFKIESVLTLQKKKFQSKISMLTCYDFQTAQMLNETDVDLILVGDSLGNVILGESTTLSVTVEHMKIFGKAVKKGAPNKFVVVDMPFASYDTVSRGLRHASDILQFTQAEAVKIEGAYPYQCELIERLGMIGVPVMGHIGLRPQSVHTQGGYHKHGKDSESKMKLMQESKNLEAAGAFAIVLECVEEELSKKITDSLKIPTIGIGSGSKVDGQVLVINDLFHNGKNDPPKFCHPVINLFEEKQKWLKKYIEEVKKGQ